MGYIKWSWNNEILCVHKNVSKLFFLPIKENFRTVGVEQQTNKRHNGDNMTTREDTQRTMQTITTEEQIKEKGDECNPRMGVCNTYIHTYTHTATRLYGWLLLMKKNSHRKIAMTILNHTLKSHCPLRGWSRGTFYWSWSSGHNVRKISYWAQPKTSCKCKNIDANVLQDIDVPMFAVQPGLTRTLTRASLHRPTKADLRP